MRAVMKWRVAAERSKANREDDKRMKMRGCEEYDNVEGKVGKRTIISEICCLSYPLNRLGLGCCCCSLLLAAAAVP